MRSRRDQDEFDKRALAQSNNDDDDANNDALILMAPPSAGADPIVGFNLKQIEELFPSRVDSTHNSVTVTAVVITQILNCIAATGSYSRACVACGTSAIHYLRLRNDNEELQELSDLARKMYADRVSATIHNRAIEGWLEPVYYLGAVVGYVRKYSDRLLETQAKRFEPEYRDKSEVDHKVSVAGVLAIAAVPQQTEAEWLIETQKVKRIVKDE